MRNPGERKKARPKSIGAGGRGGSRRRQKVLVKSRSMQQEGCDETS